MKRTMIISTAILGLALVGAVSAGSFIPSSMTLASAHAATAEQRQIFAIDDMTCALCPVTVKKAMEGVSGVKSVAVNFDAKTANVVFDPSKATVAAIAAASTNAGYPAHAVGS